MSSGDLARRVSGHCAALLRSARDCAAVQTLQCMGIIAQQRTTLMGQKLDLGQIRSVADYQACVPLASWEDLEPWIQQEINGAAGSFLPATPLAVELTGGSTSGRKMIPYSATQLAAFRAAVLPWLDDWLMHWPHLAQQSWWWAITPAGRAPAATSTGIPLGLPGGDAAYFGPELAPLLLERLAAPPQMAAISNLADWQRATVAHLLAREDLGLLSLWSPSLLLGLLDCITHESELLLDWLDHWPLPDVPAPALSASRRAALPALVAQDPSALWPALTLCSCWTDAGAIRDAALLRQRWPGLALQGKGLLATEGVVTVPLADLSAPLLALNSGFFEFRCDDGRMLLAHELDVGLEAEVVMSTWGGLLRYTSADRVRVAGHYGHTPLLTFLGRRGGVSDLCGEKLSETFVANVLASLVPGFAMLYANPEKHCYQLIVDTACGIPSLRKCAAAVEAALCANPQYAYARSLGQLASLQVSTVHAPLACLQNAAMAAGRRLGDLKPPALGGENEKLLFAPFISQRHQS